MRSITLSQAALFAALAMVLVTVSYLIENGALLADAPALFPLGSVVPGLVWAGFFYVVYRNPFAAKTGAWIALVFAVLLEAVVVWLRFQQSVNYWTPFGNALSLSGWFLRLGWAVFLIAFALARDNSRTRQIALVVAILSAPLALITIYDWWNNLIGLLFDNIPRQALWRVLITPAIRSVYWVSQILFLSTVWGESPSRQSSARLTP